MTKKTRKQIRYLIADLIHFAVVAAFPYGLFAILGSLGALELGNIDYLQFLWQCVIGIACMTLSLYSYHKIYVEV